MVKIERKKKTRRKREIKEYDRKKTNRWGNKGHSGIKRKKTKFIVDY